MPTGGPTIGGAFSESYLRAREHAIADTRHRLAEGLRIHKELLANEEAIARHRLEIRKAQAIYEQSQAELDLLRRREAEIQASPGKPYRADPYLADKLLEAERNVEASKQDVETQHRNMMETVYQRNQAIEQKAIPSRGGLPVIGSVTGLGTHQMTPEELEEEGKKTPKGKTTEFSENLMRAQELERAGDPEFEKQMAKERAELEGDERYGEQQQTTLEGLQRRQEVGREEQEEINRQERESKLFPLEERAEAQRARALEAQGGIEAAAQEIAARQRESQFIRSQAIPGGGGQGTGLLGLLGGLINKAGGGAGGGTMGSPGGGGGGGAFGGKPGAAPARPQQMQFPRGVAPTPPQRPMTPMFGQAGAPTPPVRPPGLGGVQPGQQDPRVAPGAAPARPQQMQFPGGVAPTPPPRPPGIGAASQAPTLGQTINAAAQHPIMNVPLNQVPAALEQLLGGRGGNARPQAYPQGPYPGGPGQMASPSLTPGGPAPGAPQPGAYGQQTPPPRPQMPGQATAPYSPPYGEPGGPGSVTLAGRGNVAPGSATSVTLPGVGGEGALRPPAVAQPPPARPSAMPPERPLDIDPYPRPGFKSAQAETGFRPISGEVGDLPPSYRAAIGGGAVSPHQPMPPQRPVGLPLPSRRWEPPQFQGSPSPRPQFGAPHGAAGGGVSQQARQAIANIESRGSGDYGAINKKSGAVGRYQIMPRNVPSWTKQALGRAMTPQQLAANPQAQDAVFNHIFGGYEQKYGARGAAIKWNTGKAPQERPPSAAGLAYARKFEREGGLGGRGRAAGFHDISGEASDIPGIGGAADRASGAGRALSPEALAAPLPLRSAATNVRQLNPGLLSTVTSGANRFMADNPGYKVRVNEGFNTQGHTKFSHHHNGTAMDIQIIGPDGKDIPNRGNDPTGIYRKLASSVYGSAPAGVKEKLGWGGAFETSPGSGTQDLMHFDLGGDRGNLAPSFRLAALGGGEGGATPATMAGGETPSATTGTSATEADQQQPAPQQQQQAYQPPEPPELPKRPPPQQQAPWQPQASQSGVQGGAQGRQRPQIGPPTVHDEREIAGMKPGSIFRTPDGRLKVVPIQPLQRPQQASYAGE